MTKLTTSTAAKVIAVLLLIVSTFVFAGSVIGDIFIFESGYMSDKSYQNYGIESDGNSANNGGNSSDLSIMNRENTRRDVMNHYSSFITSWYTGKVAENAEERGSSTPYLKYWTGQNLDNLHTWNNMRSCRNLAVQVYDFSDGSVKYSDDGIPAYGNQQAADDELYMYKKSAASKFLLDFTEEEKTLFNELEDQLYSIQLMPQEHAYMEYSDVIYTDVSYGGQTATEGWSDNDSPEDSNSAGSSAKTAKKMGTYGMEFVGIKIFKDGMPEDRLNGKLLFDSEEIVDGNLMTTESAENVKGYTIAVMHRNGMVSFCTLREPMEYVDYFWALSILNKLYIPIVNALIPIAVLSGLLCAALLIFLMISAGRRPAPGEYDEYGSGNENTADININANANVNAESARINEYSPDDASRDNITAETIKNAEKGFVIAARRPERIPLDVFFIALCCIIGIAVGVPAIYIDNLNISYGIKLASMYPLMVMAVVMIAACVALGIEFLMSCAVRFKLGKWWKNTLCFKICSWAWMIIRRVMRFIGRIFDKIFIKIFGKAVSAVFGQIKAAVMSIGVQWKLTLAAAAAIIINFVLGYFSVWDGAALCIAVIFDIAVMLVVLIIGLMLRRIEKGGKALASGDLDAKIDISKMYGKFKRHAENMNSISDGMAIAIDQRMRSERLKTELITNVSHDIKTPLTSIVNYIDLLSKEELEGKSAEYVEVLQRQSARLKKLTEDLVEASKAATGNINVDLRRIDIRETVNQAVGEYSEKLEKAGLDIVVDSPDTPVMAEADGRLMWRVFDNLLSNVCKYSMHNTRVYITLSESQNAADKAFSIGARSTEGGASAPTAGGKVKIEIKNISRDRLNISAEDLMERFVRGDSSRTSSTEGSGLGLNIAKSLTELQGGKFNLTVDGDLFKAEITLRK